MPPATVLKRRHDLKSVNNMGLKLLTKFKDIRIPPRTELGRVKSQVRTEDLSDDDCKRHFTSITGKDAAQILELAAAPVNGDNWKKLLHVTVILDNEIGQPAVEDLRHVENENSGDEDLLPKKKKKNHDLLQRVADLEKSKEDNVKELKDKVRSLALQANPSEPLILLSLDELARRARRQDDDDAETFDELARQAQRHQGSINVATLTLNVPGDKASDLVGKAMAKCLKEKEVEQKITGNKSNHMEKMETTSPLANAYPPATCMPNYFMPQMPTGWQQGMFPFSTSMYHNQGPRRFSPRNGQWRPRGNCFSCNSNDNVVKDCEKMKNAKGK